MRRLIILVFFASLSTFDWLPLSSSSKSSPESLNEGSASKRDILQHTIHFSTGGGAHGDGSSGGGSTSPEVGGSGSGSSSSNVPSSTAIIPVVTGGAAIRNHHGEGHNGERRTRGSPGYQPLFTMTLALCCLLTSRIWSMTG
ncbi:hypothetical protein MLD38_011251 [Melastoma candidum]|uniref:Uncharacterized protein n=1 Tax=Melastoma candidum TaxID=119954 RepID=A0ACB9R3K5_9MYRT|nr:hypothetical protein MLD38_011251 [Melastoma candidum]